MKTNEGSKWWKPRTPTAAQPAAMGRTQRGTQTPKGTTTTTTTPWWQAGNPPGTNLAGLQLAGLTDPGQTIANSYTLTPVYGPPKPPAQQQTYNLAPTWQQQTAGLQLAGLTNPGQTIANAAAAAATTKKKATGNGNAAAGPLVVNPASMAPASINQAPNNAAPGWTGDLGYGRPQVIGWQGDLGYAPRTVIMPGTIGARDMSQQFAAAAPVYSGFGTSYDWRKRAGGFGYGGGYGGSGYSNYAPAWMLALNQWNYGE